MSDGGGEEVTLALDQGYQYGHTRSEFFGDSPIKWRIETASQNVVMDSTEVGSSQKGRMIGVVQQLLLPSDALSL